MQGFKRSTGLTYVLGKLADNVFQQTESNPREQEIQSPRNNRCNSEDQ